MRKLRTYSLVSLLVVGAFVITSLTCFAEDKSSSTGKKPNFEQKYEKIKEHKMKRMVENLKLTEDQQKEIKAIQDSQKDAFIAKKEAVHKARKELRKAMRSDKTDAELRKLHESTQKVKSEFSKFRFEQVLAIRAVLTPEQKKKFKGFGRHKKGGKWKHHKGDKPK